MRVAGLEIFRRKSQIQGKCKRAEYQYLIKTRTSKNKHSRTSNRRKSSEFKHKGHMVK